MAKRKRTARDESQYRKWIASGFKRWSEAKPGSSDDYISIIMLRDDAQCLLDIRNINIGYAEAIARVRSKRRMARNAK